MADYKKSLKEGGIGAGSSDVMMKMMMKETAKKGANKE